MYEPQCSINRISDLVISSNELTIRAVEFSEVEKLQQIAQQTFNESFEGNNTDSDMRDYLKDNFNLNKMGAELDNPNSTFYFVESTRSIIGYLKLNRGDAQTANSTENALEIERIYVFKEFHGKQVGQMLFDKSLQIARTSDVNYLWLGVWEKNARAINFYEKNNFVKFGEHPFKLGADLQTDIMMKLELK